jgi:UDP-glucose 4-epimerase
VRAIEAALRRNLKGTFQLGSGKPTSLLQLIDVLGKVTGRSLNVQFRPGRVGEVHKTWCDISKAELEIGYSAPTNIEHGIRQTWDWFLANQHIWRRQISSD